MEPIVPRCGGGVVSAMRCLEDDVEGGVLGRGEEELERFLCLKSAIHNRHDGPVCGRSAQGIELENIGMRIRGPNDQIRAISASWVSNVSPRRAIS